MKTIRWALAPRFVLVFVALLIVVGCGHSVKVVTIPDTKEAEQHLLARAFSSGSNDDYTRGKFSDPLASTRTVTSSYGVKRAGNRVHEGVDLRASLHTKVKAINSGKVVLVARLLQEGLMVVIDHGRGIFSVYMHLSEILVKQNEMVKNDQTIAYSGDTGEGVTGPHLHLGVRFDGGYVDPLLFIKISNKYKK